MTRNIKTAYSKRITWKKYRKQGYLQIIAIIGTLYMIVFSYLPMMGIILAFKNYRFSPGIMGIINSENVGFKYFIEFSQDYEFWNVIRNTLVLSILKILFTFPVPIMLAIAFNEVSNLKVKRIVQTVSYLPYFISWVIVSTIMFSFFNTQDGLINQMIVKFGIVDKPLEFLVDPKYFRSLMVVSDIWKNSGWWAIIFLAAIAGVDATLYEAAIVDGAGRIQRIYHITLPAIKGAIMIVLILSLGGLLGGGLGGSNFEQSYLLGNQVNKSVSNILQTYALTLGLRQGRYSYASAIGLAQSIISLILIYGSNYTSKKLTKVGLF